MSKPSIPQGTRDFSAAVVRKRNYIFNTIKAVFELYGFEPLETPAMENLETLMGKYGDEGDKLIFKILNNGLDNPEKQEKIKEDFKKILEGKNNKGITERALRYDLTIPFARYVAMNHHQLTFPFKRFQIQPVWRADRPQRGRYREFYQCDVDVVGSNSLLNEVELIHIYATVFKNLKIDIAIKINSRKILQALAEVCGGIEKLTDITIAIDKLDKIGIQKVTEELLQRGLNAEQIATITSYLTINGNNVEKFSKIKSLVLNNEIGKQGIAEIEYLLSFNTNSNNLVIDFTLARGLNYYTGIIFEVVANNIQMGSIGGGGRYDNLTELFGVPNISGVGISFGVDRIYDVMEELNLFPKKLQATSSTKVLFLNYGNLESRKAYDIIIELRKKKIGCELYFDEQSKIDKQFKYAEKKGIKHVAILGSEELDKGEIIIKNLQTGVKKFFHIQDYDSIIKEIRSKSKITKSAIINHK